MSQAILTDIEGTTSAIDFVHKVLFPYAAERLPDFVRQHSHHPQVAEALADTAAQAGLDSRDHETLIEQLLTWIAEDKKITPLKTLQGLIWEDGYRQGHYRAHMYDDAVAMLRQWHGDGLPLYVYSSGSIHAQKLFFEFSEAGNLLPLLSGHFDTTTGPKRDPASYCSIADALALPAGDIVFLSDIVEELDAAAEAGMRTVWVQRGGDPIPSTQHQCVASFTAIRL